MKLFTLLAVASAFLLRARDEGAVTDSQPVRCAVSVCKPFDSDCSTGGDCVTDKCYEGKCGMGQTCAAANELCFTDSPHTCCTGECQGVLVRDDCLRLLGLEGSVVDHEGVNVDRQCERVGICKHWPGKQTGPSILATPWAIDPADNVAKYYSNSGMTFVAGTTVDTAKVVARRMGQAHTGVNPYTTRPRGIVDAGVLHFVEGTRVAREIVSIYTFGDTKYCVSPVLLDGQGGGYYAVGVDCCTDDAFSCGDANGLSAVVVSSNLPDFAQARLILEAKSGIMYHGEGRGLETDSPMYVSWSALPAEEQNKPTHGMEYILEVNKTYCAAPVGNHQPVGWWAVGEDCCFQGNTTHPAEFNCGDVADPAALSGALVSDITGDYIQAVKQGEFMYGVASVGRPIFVGWTSETLVPTP